MDLRPVAVDDILTGTLAPNGIEFGLGNISEAAIAHWIEQSDKHATAIIPSPNLGSSFVGFIRGRWSQIAPDGKLHRGHECKLVSKVQVALSHAT